MIFKKLVKHCLFKFSLTSFGCRGLMSTVLTFVFQLCNQLFIQNDMCGIIIMGYERNIF